MTAINSYYYNVIERLCLLALIVISLMWLVLAIYALKYTWKHRYDDTTFYTDGSSFKEGLKYNLEIDKERIVAAFNRLRGKINEKLGKH